MLLCVLYSFLTNIIILGMDISGDNVNTIISEIKNWGVEKGCSHGNSLRFQNHLYGCLAYLETLADENPDISDNENDMISNFKRIGVEYGFMDSDRCEFTTWTEAYRMSWISIWNTIGKDKNLELIDALEAKIFKFVNETTTESEFEFFKFAVNNSELTDVLMKKALETLTFKLKRTEGKTRRVHGRRSVTPIATSRPRVFKKTRKLHRPSLPSLS